MEKVFLTVSPGIDAWSPSIYPQSLSASFSFTRSSCESFSESF